MSLLPCQNPSLRDRREIEFQESFIDVASASPDIYDRDVLVTRQKTGSPVLKLTSIANQALRCQAELDTLLHALEERGETQGDELSVLAIEDQVGRFRLWAGNVGAFHEGRSSLDYRLKDAKFIAQNVERLLDSLVTAIIKATHVARSSSSPMQDAERESMSIPSDYETSSDSSGGADPGILSRTELAEHYLTITEIIERLSRLSVAIKSSSVQNSVAKAASFIERDENGVIIPDLFEQSIGQLIVRRYPHLSLRIVERLSRTIGRRRRQLVYQRRNREKLKRVSARVTDYPMDPVQMVKSDYSSSLKVRGLVAPASAVDTTDGPEPTDFHRNMLSNTAASHYILRPEQSDKVSIRSFSAASSVSKDSDVDIPSPPFSSYGDEELFECPYCYSVLSPRFKKERIWRKHVFDDLEPYICLFEDCLTPDQTFTNFQDWVDHEEWSHNLQWCCDISSHKPQLFESRNQLEDHLQDAHHEDVTDAEIRQLVERNRRPAPILWTECSFCKFVPDVGLVEGVSDKWSRDELISKNLIKHVGHHLRTLSAFALLKRDDLEDDAVSQKIGPKGANVSRTSSLRDTFGATKAGGDLASKGTANDELDLRPLLRAEDLRWDLEPANFQGIDMDDSISRPLHQDKVVSSQKSNSKAKSKRRLGEKITLAKAQKFEGEGTNTSTAFREQARKIVPAVTRSISSKIGNLFHRSAKGSIAVTLQSDPLPGDIHKTSVPVGKVTPEEVRKLAELIRLRYKADDEIWSLRYVRPRDRPVVEEKMRRADATLHEMWQIVQAWDRSDAFHSKNDWAKMREIRRRIEEDGKRHWAANPPWSE